MAQEPGDRCSRWMGVAGPTLPLVRNCPQKSALVHRGPYVGLSGPNLWAAK